MACPDVRHLASVIPGDSGDALLNLWILRAVQAGIPHGWHGLWNAPAFAPATHTLLYSDAMLPVAILHWPLRLVFGDALAFNVIYLGSWVLCSWCTYRLAARFTESRGAAFVAALAFTYSSIRLVHHQHFQVVVGGALVPLLLLTLLQCLDAPSIRRGLCAGLAFAAVTLSSTYYGAMSAIIVLVVVGGWLIAERPRLLRPLAEALGAAALVVAVLVAPVAAQYVALQRQPEFRRTFDSASAAHVDDFLSTGPANYLLMSVPLIAPRSVPESRGIENRLFPGLIALVCGLAGAVVVFTRRRRTDLVLIAIAGAITLVLAFGDHAAIGHIGFALPFAALRRFAPGFAGIRATARFALGGELALAVLAAVGFDALVRGRSTPARVALTVVAAALVIAESAMGLAAVRVPTTADAGGVTEALRGNPGGVVLELPMESSARGLVWPYVESPRQFAAVYDGHPRANGYSGFEPQGFAERAAVLNQFPSPEALDEARRLGIRFVVLRTALVGTLSPAGLAPALDADAAGRYAVATARRLLAGLPSGDALKIEQFPGAFLVELR